MSLRLRLVETEREYRNFTLRVIAVFVLIVWVLTWRTILSPRAAFATTAALVAAATLALWQPRLFRGFYVRGMTANHWLGERMGRIFLVVFYIIVMCPLGLLLRLGRYDPLGTKKRPIDGTYWVRASKRSELDRMF